MIMREVTKYENIKQTIEQQIADGHLNVGDRLPSRSTLASRYSVSQAPVRQAIRELTRQGVIHTRTGQRGLFVARAPDGAPEDASAGKSPAIAVPYATLQQTPAMDDAPQMLQLFMEAMTEQALHDGPALRRMPYPLPPSQQEYSSLRQALEAHRIVVFMGADYVHWAEYLKSAGTHAIYVTPLWVPDQINVIIYDPMVAQGLTTTHLLALGHRAIGFVGDVNVKPPAANKFFAWCRTMLAGNVELTPDWIVSAPASQMEGYMAARKMLERLPPPRRPTAIVADTDYKAIGVMAAIRGMGLRVPEDISVVGLDTRPVARACKPQLTTAGPRWAEAGRVILQAVQTLTQNPDERLRIDIPLELINGASSAPPIPR
jgi:DNA-binding LacI/PurR family transcriptional regulator/DNA-binding transcriptional regulator YhcF (GntR family)